MGHAVSLWARRCRRCSSMVLLGAYPRATLTILVSSVLTHKHVTAHGSYTPPRELDDSADDIAPPPGLTWPFQDAALLPRAHQAIAEGWKSHRLSRCWRQATCPRIPTTAHNAATICIDGVRRASVIKLLRAAARLPGPFTTHNEDWLPSIHGS